MPEIKELMQERKELRQQKEQTTSKAKLNIIQQRLDEIRTSVHRQSKKTPQGPQVQELWDKKEVWEEALESVREKVRHLQKEYASSIITKLNTQLARIFGKKEKGEGVRPSLFDVLIRILILAMFLILTFLLYCIIVFFLPFMRDKRKFKKVSRKLKHGLTIIAIYDFLCRIFNIFGYRYPVVIDPEEYSIGLIKRFGNVRSDVDLMTGVFLEARYSTHEMIKQQVENALNSYKNILRELKDRGNFWQKIILKLDFVFKLQTQK